MKTLQEQYNLLKEGKGDKNFFMKSIRNLFPEYVNQFTSYNDAVHILKSKSILSEGIGGVVTKGTTPDWHKIFKENIAEVAKAEEKKSTKDVTDMETRGFDYKDPKNIDNVYGQEFLKGYYAEIKDPKNKDKSVDELKTIVAKNLAKDNQYYVKDGQFGIKGLGYTTDAPGLGKTKEVKGKYASSGMEPVKLKESVLAEGIHDKDITSASHTNVKTPPKGVGDYDPKARAASLARLANFGPKSKPENTNNDLEMAKQEAQENSKEGYVQHVNKTDDGYEVSDWYDSDTTVCSYENGEEINNREDMFMDDEFANDLDNYDDDMYNQSYQWDDENPDLRDLGANPKLYEEMQSGVDYDSTAAVEIKAKAGDLKKIGRAHV